MRQVTDFVLVNRESVFERCVKRVFMGNSSSAGVVRGYVELDTYRKDIETTQQVIAHAFAKCVVPLEDQSNPFGSAELTADERRCVTEYMHLYSQYSRAAFGHFMGHYDKHQRQMYEKEAAARQA